MRQHAFDDARRRRRALTGTGGRELRLDPGRPRRWKGRVAYWLLFAAVVAGFMVMFEHLTGSRAVAVVAVGFLVGYMLLAAHVATRHLAAPSHTGGLG